MSEKIERVRIKVELMKADRIHQSFLHESDTILFQGISSGEYMINIQDGKHLMTYMSILIDLGTEDQIKRGMKIWDYRLKEVEQLRWKEMHLGDEEDVEIIGEGKIEEVERECSFVLPGQKSELNKLRIRDHVIMK